MRRGFTLLEVLVSMATLGVLFGLVLSGIQRTRESANRLKCQNNLRQLGVASLGYENQYGKYPDGGRKTDGMGFFGEILPFVDMGNIKPKAALVDGNPVPVFYCPSRHGTATQPWIDKKTPTGMLDYAWPTEPLDTPNGWWCGRWTTAVSPQYIPNWVNRNSVMMTPPRSTTVKDILDGTSSTILLAEKRVSTDCYDGGCSGNDNSPYQSIDQTKSRDIRITPSRDPLRFDWSYSFGSAHAGGLNVLFCDGSVRLVSYSVANEVWHGMGTKAGREKVD